MLILQNQLQIKTITMKKCLFPFLMISILIFAGCGSDDKGSDDNECKNEVITRNDSIIITGCSNYEPTLTFTTGGYLLTMSEQTANSLNLEVYQTAFSSYMGVKASSASALRDDGWYSQDGIWEHLEGSWKWRITATAPYRIVFAKMPLAKRAASTPITYQSAGLCVVGPFHVAGSSATFTIACPDAKLAGFTAELYDAAGQEVLANYTNILDVMNLDENNNQINNYSKTTTLTLAEGDYLIKVAANNQAFWTVKVE
jgi:hypothetical protein